MKRREDLFLAFLIAVAAHGAAGVCANRLLAMSSTAPAPLFQTGLSSVDLSLARHERDAVPAEDIKPPEPDPAVVEPDEATLADEPLPAEADADEDVIPADAEVVQGVEGAEMNLTSVRPVYPLGSRLRGEEGTVRVRVLVGTDGRAQNVEVIQTSGFPLLDRSAVDALKKARFAQSSRGLTPAVEVDLAIRFRLVN